MTVGEYSPCELLDLQKPPMPTRSRLYHLEPIGLGTPDVESLTSYVARLAEAHCLTPLVLIRDQIAPLIEQEYTFHSKTPNMNKLRERAQHLNGTNLKAAALVQALETLTLYPGLHCLTMLNWNKVISQKGLLRNMQAWCPMCYEEWHQAGKVIYEPLIWALNVVKICPHHRQPLQIYCPHCHKQIFSLAGYSRPGYCSKCGGWLGVFSAASDSEVLLEDELNQIWVIDNIGELIAAASYLSSSVTLERTLRAINASICAISREEQRTFSRFIGKSRSYLYNLYSLRISRLPQLTIVLKICLCLKISLLNLLAQEVLDIDFERTVAQLQEQPCKNPKVLSRKAYEKSFTKNPNIEEEMRLTLLSVLESQEYPPPSMNEVARRMNVNIMTIRSYFLDLCHQISAKYLSYRKAAKQEREEKVSQQIRQIVIELHTKGIQPHSKNVEKFLPRPGVMRNKASVDAFHEVRRELGYEK